MSAQSPKMHTPNLVDNNIDRIAQLFPPLHQRKSKNRRERQHHQRQKRTPHHPAWH